MKEATEFKQRWGYAHQLRPFAREQVASLPLAKEDLEFLVEAGLPGVLEWLKPLPLAKSLLPAGFDGLYAIAEAEGYLVCVQEGVGLVRLEAGSNLIQFLDSSVIQNARCNPLVDQRLDDLESKARVSVAAVKILFRELWDELIKTDPRIRANRDCVWFPFLWEVEDYWEGEAERFAEERKTRN